VDRRRWARAGDIGVLIALGLRKTCCCAPSLA
jgi:hypothetical protein